MALPAAYVLHDPPSACRRLLAAPKDLAPAVATPPGPTSLAASPAHQPAFLQYLVELEAAQAEAEPWWRGLVDARAEREGSLEDGLLLAYSERPAGPAAHGDVVGAVRRGWLAADAVNRGLPEARRVPPPDLVLRWVAEVGRTELVTILTGMPYWPIGMDAAGEWC